MASISRYFFTIECCSVRTMSLFPIQTEYFLPFFTTLMIGLASMGFSVLFSESDEAIDVIIPLLYEDLRTIVLDSHDDD